MYGYRALMEGITRAAAVRLAELRACTPTAELSFDEFAGNYYAWTTAGRRRQESRRAGPRTSC